MNTGIQDAFNLAWKLSAVLRGHAHPALLDSYRPNGSRWPAPCSQAPTPRSPRSAPTAASPASCDPSPPPYCRGCFASPRSGAAPSAPSARSPSATPAHGRSRFRALTAADIISTSDGHVIHCRARLDRHELGITGLPGTVTLDPTLYATHTTVSAPVPEL